MSEPFKDAVGICKTIMRNGYDAYIISERLQKLTIEDKGKEIVIDISTELDFKGLSKLFPNIQIAGKNEVTAILKEGESSFYFYMSDTSNSSHPEECVSRMTPRLLKALEKKQEIPMSSACPYIPKARDPYEGFASLSTGEVCFLGIPDQTLKKDYLMGIRALRFAANYNLPIESNTKASIIRACKRILDYVPIPEIMDEWRKVEAENMYIFVSLLFETMLLHGLIPEIAGLSRFTQVKNSKTGETETVFNHTLDVMRLYPEELPYDWFGVVACLFHDVGKVFTAEKVDGEWQFLQHHRVGAKVTRKILTRLNFPQEDVDLICGIVRNHMRFHFMLTDKGIRKFKAIAEYPRLIEMVRADIKARGSQYKEFNHNLKMLERADIPEEALDPFLNGNEIMQYTGLNPGPVVGIIRESLLIAQISGDVSTMEEAIEYVKNQARMEKLIQ
ncbi:HD domain-containing protein [Desulfovibrio gilichinskyi]|uniref:Poly(A) polymerase n=1 Tax=Desulfovibrio gilichinskyi TaxID=1519643 RepID=A0A1X7E083_9BACT|nr:HD domain-containing protein [Desulfovibrio gilichinskyi]SMF25068.1 poly(A) polymerase [Desulfovibrio gilichinskyi]